MATVVTDNNMILRVTVASNLLLYLSFQVRSSFKLNLVMVRSSFVTMSFENPTASKDFVTFCEPTLKKVLMIWAEL